MINLEFFQVKLREIAEIGSPSTLEEKVVRLLRGRFPIDPAVSTALKQWTQSSLVGLEPEPIEELSAFVVPGTGQRTTHYHIGPNRRFAAVARLGRDRVESGYEVEIAVRPSLTQLEASIDRHRPDRQTWRDRLQSLIWPKKFAVGL